VRDRRARGAPEAPVNEAPEKRNLDIVSVFLVEPAEARDGAKKRVSITRIVRCPDCFATYRAGPGCDACDGGLATREETLTVTVPAGVEGGTQLRLAGKGHESTRDDTGDLYLTITLPKAAPAPPPAPPPSAWKRFLSEPGTIALGIFAGCVLALIGAVYVIEEIERASRSPVGAACTKGPDCASGMCMELYSAAPTIVFPGKPAFHGFPQKTGSVCSRECREDADCPATMECAPAERHQTYTNLELPVLGPGKPNTMACSPRATKP